MGLKGLLVDDRDGRVANPHHLRRAQANLRRKQKALSRKRRGSKNRGRARRHVARAHERVADARADFQHRLSRRLVDEHQVIVAEPLKVTNMLKNRRLARAVSDAGWSSLLEKVACQARDAGRTFLKIDQWAATTKTCSCCGHRMEKMPLTILARTCPSCGSAHDRDVDAAVNVKALGIEKLKASGLRLSACQPFASRVADDRFRGSKCNVRSEPTLTAKFLVVCCV